MLLALLFIISTATIFNLFFFAIQQGQIIDMIFNWQRMLNRIDRRGGFGNVILSKILGLCEYCTAHAISVLSFIVFVIIHLLIFNKWIYPINNIIDVLVNMLIYLSYVSISTYICVLTIFLLQNKKR